MSKIPSNKINSSKKLNSSSRTNTTDKSSTDALKEHGFEVGEVLGEGTYSKVRSATYKNREIAVKVITRAKVSEDFLTKFLPREIEVLSKLEHENIIKVFKIFDYPDRVYIFMELAQNDVLNYIRDRGRLKEKETRFYMRQIVSALKYLHSLQIAHRDLKCENIMISEKNVIKLIDFGFCRTAVDSSGRRKLSETYCGSTAYAAPEVLQGDPYNPMMYDVWSLGCVLYIMVTGLFPFDDRNVRKMLKYQLKRKIKFPSSSVLSFQIKDLIKKMLEPDVTKRISIDRASKNAWLQMEDPSDSNDEDETEDEDDEHSKRSVAPVATHVDISSIFKR